MSRAVDLDHVNKYLSWNPYPTDRESEREILWARGSESPRQDSQEHQFRSILNRAKLYAQRLAKHHEGRTILNAENPDQNVTDSHYWPLRTAYFKAECEKLEDQERNRPSRSVTPRFIFPGLFGNTQLDQAKGHAQNAAFRLASLPAGKALLETEDHSGFETDYEYWCGKEKFYEAQYESLPKESELERAKRHANTIGKKLATFARGKELLYAEDDRFSISDLEYWQRKEENYRTEHDRLQQDFWNEWQCKHFGGRQPGFAVLSPSPPPSKPLNASAPPSPPQTTPAPNKRGRALASNTHSKRTRNYTRRNKRAGNVPTNEGNVSSAHAEIKRVKRRLQMGRRMGEDTYEHRQSPVTPKQKSPWPEQTFHIPDRGQANVSEKSKARQAMITSDYLNTSNQSSQRLWKHRLRARPKLAP